MKSVSSLQQEYFRIEQHKLILLHRWQTKKFYVVWEGRFKGIFNNWDDCKKAVHGFNGAKYKGFTDRNSAEAAWKNGFQYAKVDSPLKMPIINAKTEPPLEEYIAVVRCLFG